MATELNRCRPLLGTLVEIAVASASASAGEAAIEAAFAEIALVHRLMSFHDAESDVSRINRAPAGEAVAVDRRTFAVLSQAQELRSATGGMFDISIAPYLQQLGRLPLLSAADDSAGACELILEQPNLVRKCSSGRIDLGGIAKGYAVDRAIDVLRQHGVASGLINAGGDVAVLGAAAWPVAVRDPRDPSRYICEVMLTEGALASSAGYFDPLTGESAAPTAILDPASGAPAQGLAGVSVRAPTCMIADALTKVVMLDSDGSLGVLERYGAAALAVTSTGEIMCTPGWPMEARRAA